MRASVIKPGLLVVLKTSIKGGIDYTRTEIETEHRDEEGAIVAKWQTDKKVHDPAEWDRAVLARTAARGVIAKVCAYSPNFGYMCNLANEAGLEDAIRQAREIANLHNSTAQLTNLQVSVICGRIAQDDVEAAKAIAAEVRELLDAMQEGIKSADPAAIRDAASKARQLGGMLSEDVAGKVDEAIKEARAAAREIVKRVEKSGELAAQVIGELNLTAIEGARFAFLDLDEGAAVKTDAPARAGIDIVEEAPSYDDGTGEREPMPEVKQFRGIEIEDDTPALAAAPATSRTLELF